MEPRADVRNVEENDVVLDEEDVVYLDYMEHRPVLKNLEGEDVVYVDSVKHCPVVRNLENNHVVHVDSVEHCPFVRKDNGRGQWTWIV